MQNAPVAALSTSCSNRTNYLAPVPFSQVLKYLWELDFLDFSSGASQGRFCIFPNLQESFRSLRPDVSFGEAKFAAFETVHGLDRLVVCQLKDVQEQLKIFGSSCIQAKGITNDRVCIGR